MQPVQDLTIEDKVSRTQYQFSVEDANADELRAWVPKLVERLRQDPRLADVASDQQEGGLQAYVDIDRAAASRYGVTPAMIDNALYNAFGQRLVSTIFTQTNQYRVVLEVAARVPQGPGRARQHLRQRAERAAAARPRPPRAAGAGREPARSTQQIPLSALAQVTERTAPLVVSRIGQFPAATISFNLARGASLGDAVKAIEAAQRDIGLPASAQVKLQGAALAFRASLANQLWLILAAIVTVYIVLGVLYESYIHPITILSTLPSAGVGALLALQLSGNDLGVIAIIGIILLIGIVKKNAIMMIDFAIDAEREQQHGAARRDLPGLPAALPPDHDDHDGGAAGRAAADDRLGRGLGAAPSARHHDGRRPDREPGADAVHHAGRLSRVRPAGAPRDARRAAASRAPRLRPPTRAARARHEHLDALHRSPGRDDAAHDRLRAGRRGRLPPAAGVAAAAGRPADHLGLRVAARARAPRRWRRRSPCRSSARSASSPASRR